MGAVSSELARVSDVALTKGGPIEQHSLERVENEFGDTGENGEGDEGEKGYNVEWRRLEDVMVVGQGDLERSFADVGAPHHAWDGMGVAS